METEVMDTPAAPDASTPGTESGPVTTETTQTAPDQPAQDEGFIDEGVLATLTPESRVVVDPVIKTVKEKFDKLKSEHKDYSEKAQAFDILSKDPRFISWYRGIMNPASNQPEKPPEAPPQPEVTEQMLQEAAGDPVRYAQLLEKRFEAKYGAQQAKLEAGQRELKLATEFDVLSRTHPDLWELDKAGLFEPFLYFYTDLNKRPMVEAYAAAKKVGDFFSKQAQARATGIVQDRKASVTEAPSTVRTENRGVVYAKDADEALRMQIAENFPGGLKRQVIIKG